MATTPTNPPIASPWWVGETPVRVSDLPAHIPALPGGKKVSTASVYRYTTVGVRGIRIRRFRGVGNSWCTTLQELGRWQSALTIHCGGDY